MKWTKRWLCFQAGARDHYIYPRILHKAGQLGYLVTDFWGSAKNRHHEDLGNASVKSFNSGFLLQDVKGQLFGNDRWVHVRRHNAWYQQKCCEWLKSKQDKLKKNPGIALFYSHTAKNTMKLLKSWGWKCVVIQINPGPEEELIVQKAHDNLKTGQSTWAPTPSKHWEDWREEIDMADAIVANSEWSANLLAKAGVPKNLLHTIPLAYEAPNSFPQRNKPTAFTKQRPLRILYLGQQSVRKGIDLFVEAVESLNDERLEALIVGPKEWTCEWGQLKGRYKTFGPVPRSRVKSFYEKSDAFILPTRSDGFAITQLESLHRGCPVIATPNCASVIQHVKNGYQVDKPDAKLIATVFKEWIQHPESLHKLQNKSYPEDKFTQTALEKALNQLDQSLSQ